MARTEVTMPKLGESVMEATITNWLVAEGDTIEMDQPLVEIATDKVDSEVPSPFSGVLVKKIFSTNEVVKIGEAFAIIESDVAAAKTEAPVNIVPEISTNGTNGSANAHKEIVNTVTETKTPVISKSDSSRFYSPLVKTIAVKENISLEELEKITGTGLDGRVTKQDILAYVETGKSASQKTITTVEAPVTVKAQATETKETVHIHQKPAISISGNDQIIEMDRMRKLIAQHMVMSKHTSPHVTSFVEADVTNLVRWRDKVKGEFEKKYGEKLTFTPMLIEAVVQAIKEFPGVNASVDGDKIIIKGRINIGMAAALPSGNLIVPVIKNADQMNLFGLTKAVNDLAGRAKKGKLLPDEIADGTYTVSNVGTFGNVMGTPIINQPQVAILALGAIRKRPAVIETADGDVIAIRNMMFLSHSYDHRVVDGALGGMFVRRVADLLEGFDVNRAI
jgi:2-oxoglutarate dehydrogenase E2 component (dihydrolipoamide succinyltransferase)